MNNSFAIVNILKKAIKHSVIIISALLLHIAIDTYGQTNEDIPGNNLRDPFWPPNYTPVLTQKDESDIEEPSVQDENLIGAAKWPTLKVKGITAIGNKYSAIVDGIGIIEEGKIISLKRGNTIFSWQVLKITSKNVDFKQLEAKQVK